MLKFLLAVLIVGYINLNNTYKVNNKVLNTINTDCNHLAYSITNNYDLYNSVNINNYLKEINNDSNDNLNEIIRYNKIRLNCIRDEEKNIINDLIICYMTLFGLLFITYI